MKHIETQQENSLQVVTNVNEVLVKITKEGKVYHKGNLVKTDEEYLLAFREIINIVKNN